MQEKIISGLDPASPLFKHHLVREPSTKLDATKADFVDVIHTDGSAVFTDGFGLLRFVGFWDLSSLITTSIHAQDFVRKNASWITDNFFENSPTAHINYYSY